MKLWQLWPVFYLFTAPMLVLFAVLAAALDAGRGNFGWLAAHLIGAGALTWQWRRELARERKL